MEPDKLKAVLDAANRAPSAGNLQSYEIYVTARAEDRAALACAARRKDFIKQAPVSLVFCAHPARAVERFGERGIRLYSVQDATIACAFAVLAATALGLATVWVGSFDEAAVRRVLGLAEGLQPVAILPLGYAAEEPGLSPRRPLEDLVHQV
ncbi:MAG: nitroreductase family protein [Acidobacteria bacterium]|nr:nitroreductase family protein [Acidobacteriota bacterium]